MNNVTPFRGQKIASAFAHLKPKSLAGGIQSGFSSLNYRGKVWSLRHQGETYKFVRPDDGTPLSYLDVIILDVAEHVSRAYYPEWSEDAAEGPICSSIRGDAPDPGVPEPQSKLCATCPHGQWTTLPNGKRGMECQNHKRLAVLLMPAMTKKLMGAPLLEPVYLKVPPGSLNALKAYDEMLRHEGYPFPAVLTRISFSPDKLFQMMFDGRQVLSDTEAPLVLPLIDDPRTKRIIGEEPEIREVQPRLQEATRVETGLHEAFRTEDNVITAKEVPIARTSNGSGAEPEVIPPLKRRGRPPKNAVKDPAPVIESEAETTTTAGAAFDEEDSDLDREMAELLNKKTENMLK